MKAGSEQSRCLRGTWLEKPSLGPSFPQKTPFKADTRKFTALVSWRGEKDCS